MSAKWEMIGSADEAVVRAQRAALEGATAPPGGWAPVVTLLPDAPADGAVVGFLVRPGLVWWLRYRAAA